MENESPNKMDAYTYEIRSLGDYVDLARTTHVGVLQGDCMFKDNTPVYRRQLWSRDERDGRNEGKGKGAA